MSEDDTIKLILDPDNLPPMTAKRRALLARLDAIPDDEIDLSDIPEWDFERYPMTRAVPEAAPARPPAAAVPEPETARA